MTYREALVNAALCGWKGDDPCLWSSPAAAEDILAWGASFCSPGTDSENLLPSFNELVEEGLFFEVHAGLFETPFFYCSYDDVLLAEVTNDLAVIEFWQDWAEEFDEEHGEEWRANGLCAGRGSQGPSDSPWGPCRGDECCWYKDGDKKCNWGHKFAERE